MAKSITIWRTWNSEDMAASDQFFATKKAAMDWVHQQGGDMRLCEIEENGTVIYRDGGEGYETYLKKVEVTPTREGIASALTNIPHR